MSQATATKLTGYNRAGQTIGTAEYRVTGTNWQTPWRVVAAGRVECVGTLATAHKILRDAGAVKVV